MTISAATVTRGLTVPFYIVEGHQMSNSCYHSNSRSACAWKGLLIAEFGVRAQWHRAVIDSVRVAINVDERIRCFDDWTLSRHMAI